MSKKGFTMIEIIIMTVVVGVGLLSILLAINRSKSLTFQIKQEIIANQLAKEGVELMYQTRNSNLLQHKEQKDICWLNENPYEYCDGENSWFSRKNYIITSQNTLSGTDLKLNLLDGVDEQDQYFAICLSGSAWESCPGQDNFSKYGSFFRVIKGYGLYEKDGNINGGNFIDCPNGNLAFCINNTPKEYRFCSEVYFLGDKIKKLEICSLLTNFFD